MPVAVGGFLLFLWAYIAMPQYRGDLMLGVVMIVLLAFAVWAVATLLSRHYARIAAEEAAAAAKREKAAEKAKEAAAAEKKTAAAKHRAEMRAEKLAFKPVEVEDEVLYVRMLTGEVE